MQRDKQLRGVKLGDVLQRRRLDQALNTKEFAVLAGISYSTAREWFRVPGFPVINGVIFWDDFVEWRRTQIGLRGTNESTTLNGKLNNGESVSKTEIQFHPRAARILSEAS